MTDITLTVKKLADQLASEMRSAYQSDSDFLRLAYDAGDNSVDTRDLDTQVKGWYLQQIDGDYRVAHGSFFHPAVQGAPSQSTGLLLAYIDASASTMDIKNHGNVKDLEALDENDLERFIQAVRLQKREYEANCFAPIFDVAQSNDSIEEAAKFAIFCRIADFKD